MLWRENCGKVVKWSFQVQNLWFAIFSLFDRHSSRIRLVSSSQTYLCREILESRIERNSFDVTLVRLDSLDLFFRVSEFLLEVHVPNV
jgi:CYTH domain-containing protein